MDNFEHNVRQIVQAEAQGLSRAEAEEKTADAQRKLDKALPAYCFEMQWIREDQEARVVEWQRIVDAMNERNMEFYAPEGNSRQVAQGGL